MSNALIIPKYKLDKALYSDNWNEGNAATNFIEYDSNIILGKIADLNCAGTLKLNEADIAWSRITIAPDYGTFMLMITDVKGNAYFILYDLNTFAEALDNSGSNTISLKKVEYFNEFKINDFIHLIGSFQGFGIDNNLNIYISSEYSPTIDNYFSHDRRIIKIPWNNSDPRAWRILNMTDDAILDHENCTTEFKSIQVIKENNIFLTVEYYQLKIDDHLNRTVEPVCNRVFEVNWSTDIKNIA